jgi:hypothetical protein
VKTERQRLEIESAADAGNALGYFRTGG